VDRMAANASLVTEALADHPEVDWLRYPYHPSHPQYELARRQMSHGGTIVSFNLKGGKKSAWQVLDALELIDISNNLGDAKSLACHPATTTHSSVAEEDRLAMGIGDGLIRLSVGLEHADDLIADLCRALDTLRCD